MPKIELIGRFGAIYPERGVYFFPNPEHRLGEFLVPKDCFEVELWSRMIIPLMRKRPDSGTFRRLPHESEYYHCGYLGEGAEEIKISIELNPESSTNINRKIQGL